MLVTLLRCIFCFQGLDLVRAVCDVIRAEHFLESLKGDLHKRQIGRERLQKEAWETAYQGFLPTDKASTAALLPTLC